MTTNHIKALFEQPLPKRSKSILSVVKQFLGLYAEDGQKGIFESLLSAESSINNDLSSTSLKEMEEKKEHFKIAFKYEKQINALIDQNKITIVE